MGQTLEQILSELPPTKESIESIKLTITLMKEDRDTTDNQERKRILGLNIKDCEKRIKEIGLARPIQTEGPLPG